MYHVYWNMESKWEGTINRAFSEVGLQIFSHVLATIRIVATLVIPGT
jgi:hypothetical protein